MPEGIAVFRIDYEIRNSEDGEQKLWSACIAAYNQEEALGYLGRFLGKTFKTIQFERRSRLDAITDNVRNKIIENYLKDEAAGKLKKGKVVTKAITPKAVTPKKVTPRGKSITKK